MTTLKPLPAPRPSNVKAPRRHTTLLAGAGLAVWLAAGTAQGQLQVLPEPEPPRVFGGGTVTIPMRVQNTGELGVEAGIQAQLMAVGAAIAAPLGQQPGKYLEVLPGQTILEHAVLDLPDVRAETRFQVYWLGDANLPIGVTELLVYPTNQLAEIKSLAGGEALGVLDPGEQFTPWLRRAGVGFTDLKAESLAEFRGRLAILAPMKTMEDAPAELGRRVEAMARNGVATLWFQAPRQPHEPLAPSFHPVLLGTNAVVLAQTELVLNLAESPRAQANLVELCRFALRPEPPTLPHARQDTAAREDRSPKGD